MKRNLLFCLSLWALCAFTTTAVAEEVDYTSYIVNADLSTTDAWNTEGTKGISEGVVKVGSGSTFDFSQTITIPAGHYKMTAKAAYRYGANEQEEYDAIQAGANTHLAKLYAQTAAQTFEANVFNRYEGASETDYAAGEGSVTVNGLFVPNSSNAVKTWFEAGQYVNVLEFDVLEDGDVKIGIVKTESAASGDYANIGAWTLTRTGDAQNTGDAQVDPIDVTSTYLADNWSNRVVEVYAGWGALEKTSGGEEREITLPAGDYRLTGRAFYRYGQSSFTDPSISTGYMYAGENEMTVATLGSIPGLSAYADNMDQAHAAFYTNNYYLNTLDFSLAEEATIKVGYRCTHDTMKSWFIFGEMKLYQIPLEGLIAEYNVAYENVKGLDQATLNTAINDEVNKAIADYAEVAQNGPSLMAATEALNAVYNKAVAVQAALAALSGAIEAAKAVAPVTAELTAAIEAAEASYDTLASAEAINTATAILTNTTAVAGASSTNPVVTNFVVNGTFDTTTSPWKSTTGAQNQGLASNQTGAFTGNFFENWNSGAYTGKIYQTIENIPNGVYELSICAFVEAYGNGTNQFVYANEAKTYLTTGAPTAYKVLVEVTNNTIEVGFEQSEAVNQWCGIDNVSLAYYGNCTIDEARFGSYIKQVTELRATATEYLTKVNEANKAALEAALAATESIEQTEEAYQAAVATLTAANAAAKANADVKVAIDNMYDLLASTNVYTQEAYDTYKAAADAYLAKWESNELTETVDNPYAIHGHRAANNFDDFLLSAWGTNNFDTDLYINTWSVEGENDGSNFKVPFFEYWTGDANSLAATTKTATVPNLLPNGTYKVSAWVRVRAKNGQTDPTGISLKVGDGLSVDVTEGAPAGTAQMFLAEYVAMGTADAEGNLTISFNIAADNNISWLSFKNVKYTEVSTGKNLDFSEGTPIDNGICTYGKDMTTNGTTYYGLLDVEGWTKTISGVTDEKGFEHSGIAGGVFAYGSGKWLGSSANVAPATNPEGVAEGNALGIVAVWDNFAQYTQKVTLAPGNYVLTIPVYNVGQGTTAPQKSLIGFIAEDGTEYLAPAKSYTKGAWTTETITFTLDKVTEGVLSLGYDATNSGSGAQQGLFFDCVKIEVVSNVALVKAELASAIASAQATVDAKANVGDGLFMIPTAALDTYAAAVVAAQAVYDNAEATADDVTAAIEALAAATATYAATPATAPAADKTYQIMHEAAGTFLALNGGVKVEAEASPLSFVAAGDGKYYIANANGEYAYYSGTGNNNWSLNVSADNKEAWTIAAVGEGVYTIKGKSGFLGTDAATAGSTCYGNKAATNWVIAEYVEPVVPFEVTLVNPAVGTTKLEEGDFIKFTTNKDAEVGFINVGVLQVSDEDPTNTEYLASYRSAVKGESDWSVELFSTMKFRQGYTYKFEFTAYENEDAYNQEPYDAPGSAAIGTDTIAFAGTLPAYVYATATLNTITPDYGAIIENEADSIVTLTFSEPVKVVYAQTAKSEGRFMPPTLIDLVPVAVEADENGLATVWTVAMPLLPGFANISFAAEDAEGRRVWGNQGEEETSYFSYEWQCTVGIPDITIAPEGEVEGPVSTLTVSSEVQIDPYMWNGGVYDAEGNLVAEFESLDKIVDESLEMWTDEWNAAMATAPVTVTLSAEITEPGTYTVKFEAGSFMLDNAYNSKATEATFTIVKNEQVGINGIAADDVVETKYFGVNGAALDAPVKGINIVKQTLKDGKVVTSKVYVK